MDMTIRECIREMRKIKTSAAQTIWTENGTEINIPDIKISVEYRMSKTKKSEDGPIFRILSCFIKASKNTKKLDSIKRYNLCEKFGKDNIYFRNNEYYIPEKELNIFINIKGGINTYRSIDAYRYLT